ncbi:MAG: HU family DNA-binding protein [Tenericutes bacterium]|nr:HU family DNA-binding protein [Mycoplasmatota bacterium]
MTKQELVEKMAEKAGITKADAARALEAFTETVTEALKAGEKISLVGFGTFATSERAAREGRNPRTGEKVEIAARTAVSFKAGSKLKDAVNA